MSVRVKLALTIFATGIATALLVIATVLYAFQRFEREREWLARCRAFDFAALPERLRHNLPDWLALPLQARLGDEFWPWVEAVDATASLDLRVNALKADRDDVLERLRVAGIDAGATLYSPLGIRVVGKPALQKAEVFEQGLVEGDLVLLDLRPGLARALLGRVRRGAEPDLLGREDADVLEGSGALLGEVGQVAEGVTDVVGLGEHRVEHPGDVGLAA